MIKTLLSAVPVLLISAAAIAEPAVITANEITLVFTNHDLTIVGEYVGFQDEAYIIIKDETEMHIPAILVNCEGDACEVASSVLGIAS